MCGKGNNGGDGFVVARLLRQRGYEVDVILLGSPDELQGDAAANCERLPGRAAAAFEAGALDGSSAIVDAILGTGFSGAPREPAAGAISAINEAGARRGRGRLRRPQRRRLVERRDRRRGRPRPRHRDVPRGQARPVDRPGKAHAGEVRVIEIGIPPGAPGDPQIGLIEDRVTAEIPRRGSESTKFAAGSVLVCGGSLGLTGAPSMASESAMRGGAGYVTAMIPASLNLIFETRLLEVMTVPLADDGGALVPRAAETVLERTGRGRRAGARSRARPRRRDGRVRRGRVAAKAPLPLLLDADGLNAHAGRLPSLAEPRAPRP